MSDTPNWSTGYNGTYGYFAFYNDELYFPNNNNILKTDIYGTTTVWLSIGSLCHGLCIYGDSLYLTDFSSQNVYKISLIDKTSETFVGISGAQGIVEYGGFFYIASYNGPISKIKITDPYGLESNINWSTTGIYGTSPLAISSEYLYVGFDLANDRYICRIQLSDGSVNNTWAQLPSGFPDGIVIHNGYLYASNAYTSDATNTIYRVTLTDTPEVTVWKTGLPRETRGLGYNADYIYAYSANVEIIGKYYLDPNDPPGPGPDPPGPDPPIISDICFPGDTPIETDQGIMYIKEVDATKHTIGNEKIVAITQTISLDEYLVCFEKDALGENCPDKQTLISKNHKIEYKGRMIEAYKFMASFEKIYPVQYKGDTLYNVLMEDHRTIQINQLRCETLHPSNITAQMYILQKFNHLEEVNEIVHKNHKKHGLQKKMKKLVFSN